MKPLLKTSVSYPTTNNKTDMKTLNALLLILFSSLGGQLLAQPSDEFISRDEYIERWSDEAIHQMLKYKIPASITLAQGILESANGNSELARYANNHFGIKCHGWQGETILKDDDNKNDCFRKYLTAHESFEDHSLFLKKRGRYTFLFEYEITDYKSWAKGLKKAGYATNPKYPSLLIALIEKHNLDKYDNQTALANTKPASIEIEKEEAMNVSLVGLNNSAAIHAVMTSKNNIKYVIVKQGDTYYKIAKEFELGLWQIYKYNDVAKNDILVPGDVIYLQPKRRKFRKKSKYELKKGETMKDVSQAYGIKLKNLYKMNDLAFGLNPPEGTIIDLK